MSASQAPVASTAASALAFSPSSRASTPGASCRLSPWLALGCLSPRTMYQSLLRHSTTTTSRSHKTSSSSSSSNARLPPDHSPHNKQQQSPLQQSNSSTSNDMIDVRTSSGSSRSMFTQSQLNQDSESVEPPASSSLSGNVSVVSMVAEAQAYPSSHSIGLFHAQEAAVQGMDNTGPSLFMFELLWRDFFRYLVLPRSTGSPRSHSTHQTAIPSASVDSQWSSLPCSKGERDV